MPAVAAGHYHPTLGRHAVQPVLGCAINLHKKRNSVLPAMKVGAASLRFLLPVRRSHAPHLPEDVARHLRSSGIAKLIDGPFMVSAEPACSLADLLLDNGWFLNHIRNHVLLEPP